ncbi:MAG: hypothetical protein O4861_15145 [Trichodesmium sp. St16_bin4-tuft]|nr:hypothetical protein [Trichodesmium sp. St16_bin4-tuft]
MAIELLEVVESEIDKVSGDGAYDQRKCYSPSKLQWCDNRLYIPPRKNAAA